MSERKKKKPYRFPGYLRDVAEGRLGSKPNDQKPAKKCAHCSLDLQRHQSMISYLSDRISELTVHVSTLADDTRAFRASIKPEWNPAPVCLSIIIGLVLGWGIAQ